MTGREGRSRVIGEAKGADEVRGIRGIRGGSVVGERLIEGLELAKLIGIRVGKARRMVEAWE